MIIRCEDYDHVTVIGVSGELTADATEQFKKNIFFWPRQTGPKGDLVDDEMGRVLQVPGWSNIFTQPIINRIEMLSTGVRTDTLPVRWATIGDGPLAVAEVKRLVHLGQSAPLDVGLALERQAFAGLFATTDQREGMAAFLAKPRRAAAFEGK